MSVQPLVLFPSPLLQKISEPLSLPLARETFTLIANMRETMEDAAGIGLAAVQIGKLKQVITISEKITQNKAPLTLINPEILWVSEEKKTHTEGCLSIPDYSAEIERPAKVKVRYVNLQGETQEIETDDILAICLQHEIDHLNGKILTDFLSKLKRERYKKKILKKQKSNVES